MFVLSAYLWYTDHRDNEAVTAMCAKKKTIPNKMWRIAGESLRSQPLSGLEQEQLSNEFSSYRSLRNGDDTLSTWVTPAASRLHQSAAQTVAAFLCERYAGRYEREAVVKVVSSAASIPAALVDRLVERQGFLLGAALWLLDYWKAHYRNPNSYLSLLPQEPDREVTFDIPFSEDLIHPWDHVQRTMTVLFGRDKEYRKEFRALLALIDDEGAADLRQRFKAAFLDYMDRALEVYTRLKPVDRLPPPFLGASLPDLNLLPENDIPPSQRPEVISLLLGTELVCRPVAEIQEQLHSRKAAELLSGYGTDDPYALCAAYLLLEREKDALVNLNCLTAVVIVCATRHLPWAQDDFEDRAEPFELGGPNYRLRYEYHGPVEDDEEPPPSQLMSEAQLFFNATGVVFPRNQKPSEDLICWFISQGVEEQRARELAWGAMFAYYTEAGEYGWQELDWPFDEGDEEEEAFSAEPEESLSDSLPAEDHAAQIELLTRKVKELRGALHDAERAAGRMKDQLRTVEQKSEVDRAELAQLRETLYQLRAGENPETEVSGSLVELPWQMKRRVAVFGGHDSWRKAVKPLLPGARFYDREDLPNLNIVRGADVVWLQVNAMSHKYYDRIIDAARKNGIPVRYFGSASAKKCAVQLALDELAAEKRRDEV